MMPGLCMADGPQAAVPLCLTSHTSLTALELHMCCYTLPLMCMPVDHQMRGKMEHDEAAR